MSDQEITWSHPDIALSFRLEGSDTVVIEIWPQGFDGPCLKHVESLAELIENYIAYTNFPQRRTDDQNDIGLLKETLEKALAMIKVAERKFIERAYWDTDDPSITGREEIGR